MAPSSGSSATGAEAAATGLEVSREDAGCPRSPRPVLPPEDALGPAGREGGSTPPKAEATCAVGAAVHRGFNSVVQIGGLASRDGKATCLKLSQKKCPYLLTPRDLRCWRASSAIRSRSSRVAAGREGSLLRPLRASVHAVTSQNSPQLKRVANATDKVNPGKTARASSGLTALPQKPQTHATLFYRAAGRRPARVARPGAVPRAYQTACAPRAQAPRFGYLYGMAR